MKIVYIHRKHFANAGDWWSTPHHYFEKGKVFDFIENPNNYKTEECDLLIIGGGGILELEDIPKHQLWINKFSPKMFRLKIGNRFLPGGCQSFNNSEAIAVKLKFEI